MKNVFTRLVSAMLAAALFAACATTSNPQTSPASAHDEPLTGQREVILAAHGLSCPLCASNVDRVVKAVDGVSSVQTDLEKGHVIVSLEEDHGVTRGQLIKAIEDAGFTFNRFITTES